MEVRVLVLSPALEAPIEGLGPAEGVLLPRVEVPEGVFDAICLVGDFVGD
jgi:hypothetical protein